MKLFNYTSVSLGADNPIIIDAFDLRGLIKLWRFFSRPDLSQLMLYMEFKESQPNPIHSEFLYFLWADQQKSCLCLGDGGPECVYKLTSAAILSDSDRFLLRSSARSEIPEKQAALLAVIEAFPGYARNSEAMIKLVLEFRRTSDGVSEQRKLVLGLPQENQLYLVEYN